MLLNGIVAAVITMIITIIGIPRFIMFFHKKKLGGQPTLEDVKQHASKAGTPTMGGFVFVVVSLVVSLVAALVLENLVQLLLPLGGFCHVCCHWFLG